MSDPSHASTSKRDGLQFDDDLHFQRRTWIVQRIGWVVFAMLIIAGLFGAFGGGPLSRATAGAPAEGLWIEYNRLARLQSPSTLYIHVDRRLLSGGGVRVLLAGDYVRDAQIQSTTLPVLGVAAGGLVLGADVGEDADGVVVAIHLTFERAGLVKGRIGLTDRRMVDLIHFVYP